MSSIFITATDTDAGKTFVTAGLVRALAFRGIGVRAFKPVACGRDKSGRNPDVSLLLRVQGLADPAEVTLYDFEYACAPIFAAKASPIRADRLIEWCHQRMAAGRINLFEGVGGVMVPLAEGFLVSDWLASMPAMEVILVVRARLGGISHALLSLEKLVSMGRSPAWIVVNDTDRQDRSMVDMHVDALRSYLPATARLVVLPYEGGREYAGRSCMDQIASVL